MQTILPSKASMKTLVQLQEQSHIEHMYGMIQEQTHKDIFKSWEQITKSLNDKIAELDKDPIECGNGEIYHIYTPTF